MAHPLVGDRIDQPPPRLVAIDQQLARDVAVGEGDDARVAIEPGVEHEARRQPRMHRAEIAHRAQTSSGAASIGMSLWMEAMVISFVEMSRDSALKPSLRAKRSNPCAGERCFVAALLARTGVGVRRQAPYVQTASTLLPSGSIRNAA